jgi:hypothetical protein
VNPDSNPGVPLMIQGALRHNETGASDEPELLECRRE